ncbi:major facilitator superfamily domain-containing protein [Myxozyma melibiosi]|uniref:Major facilitator superfamily domain-containing protein n=1 Tax=Myxozyma melibiosi TaxID=54550 RepID=A0ABR1F5S5_9ASCO
MLGIKNSDVAIDNCRQEKTDDHDDFHPDPDNDKSPHGILDADSSHLLPTALYPPDKGFRAYMCIFGAFWGIFASFGYVLVIGMFEEYYQSHQLKTYSASQISWISSLQTFCIVFFGVIVGRAYDIFGAKPIMIPGTFLMVVGIMTTSICTQYYQFVLSQGLCTSIGAAMVFNPCIASVSTWFIRRRALALGVTNSGACLGGIVVPILFRTIELKAGFGWGVRSLGFLMLFFSVVACCTVSSRYAPPGRQPIRFTHTYVRPFKNKTFATLCLSIFLLYWGYYIPVNYMSTNAKANGFSSTLAMYLTSVFNAGSLVSRIGFAFLADSLGRTNVFIVSLLATAILTAALWIPATSHAAIIAHAALFGVTSGIGVTVWQPLVAEISPPDEAGARLGIVSACLAFAALFCMPVGGAIISLSGGEYWQCGLFAALMLCAGAVVALAARQMITGGKWLVKR